MTPFRLQHFADARFVNCALQFFINGVDLTEFQRPEGISFGARLNPWLLHGRNTVVARFRNLTDQPGESSLEISSINSDGRRTILFNSGDSGGRTQEFVIEITERTGSALERAGAIADPGALRDEASAIAFALHKALLARDFDQLAELQRIQLEEKAIAVGLTAGDALGGYREFITEMWSSPGWQVSELNPADIDLAPSGLPNILHLRHKRRGLLVQARNQEGTFSINPFLARIDGRLRIVR